MPFVLIKRALGFCAVACLLLALGWGLAIWHFANRGPVLIEEVEYYDVDGLTRQDLLEQISKLGTQRASGQNSWRISWSAFCQVQIHSKVILPRHVRLSELGALQQQSWNSFLAALRRHEFTHQYHGEQAAKDVAARYCIGADYIIGYWTAQTLIFDYETNHGATDGVRLDLWTP